MDFIDDASENASEGRKRIIDRFSYYRLDQNSSVLKERKVEKHLAQSAVKIAVAFDTQIDELYQFAEKINDTTEKKTIKDCANLILGILNRDIIMPIVNIYPDLNPDKNLNKSE